MDKRRNRVGSCARMFGKIYTLTSLQRRVDKESRFLKPRHDLDQVFHKRRHHTLQHGGASFGGTTVDHANFQAIILGHHWNNRISYCIIHLRCKMTRLNVFNIRLQRESRQPDLYTYRSLKPFKSNLRVI